MVLILTLILHSFSLFGKVTCPDNQLQIVLRHRDLRDPLCQKVDLESGRRRARMVRPWLPLTRMLQKIRLGRKRKTLHRDPKVLRRRRKLTMKTILPKNRWRRSLKWAASTEALPRSPSSTALPDKSSRGWRMSTLIISHPHSLRLKRLPILKSQEEELLTSGNYKLIFASSIIIFFMICIYFIVLLSTTDPQLKFGMGNLRVLQES